MLGESIRDFVAEVERLTERIATLDLPESATDELSLRRAARTLEEVHSSLVEAREELAARERELNELLEFERIRYRALFESAPDAYLVTTPAGAILEANTAAERLLGQSRDALAGRVVVSTVAPEDRPAFRTMLLRLPVVETVTEWEADFAPPGAKPFHGAITVSSIRDAAGEVTSLRWLIRDATERKRLEERTLSANIELERRVADRTAELEALVRQIPGAIVLVDLDSTEVRPANEEGRELLLAVARTTAPSLEEWLSFGLNRQGQPFETARRPIVRAAESGETFVGDQIEYVLGDGGHAVFELGAAPVRDPKGKVTTIVATYWDITERERRAQAERDFVTNAAHELRTPLAALASSVEVLQNGAKEDSVERERFLSHVETQCARLQRLVHSLLVLARAQTGYATKTEEIGVGKLVDEVAADVLGERVRLELGPSRDARVVANRELASQALRNLVVNALKYAPEGDIVIRSSHSGDFVALEVVDEGPGIGPDERERVLGRFYRGVEAGDGFGLGLTIASQAAEAMRGKLEIESEEGRGTTARLLLPAGHA
jgi:two-component system, OmpR family, phosphate regulon sensor histidine kinase PhoR